MEQEKIVKEMAKLLQNGATMLDSSCPNCGKILFRLTNDTIICPSCNQEVKIVRELKNSSVNINKNHVKNDMKSVSADTNDEITFFQLNNKFSQKLNKLAYELLEIDDLLTIEKYLSNINSILDILKKMRELQGKF